MTCPWSSTGSDAHVNTARCYAAQYNITYVDSFPRCLV